MCSLDNLPSDVLWLVLRDVVADGNNYYCDDSVFRYLNGGPAWAGSGYLFEKMIPLSLVSVASWPIAVTSTGA